MNTAQLRSKIKIKKEFSHLSDNAEHRIIDNKLLSIVDFFDMSELLAFYDSVKNVSKIKNDVSFNDGDSKSSQYFDDWAFGNIAGYKTIKEIRAHAERGTAHPSVLRHIGKYRDMLKADGFYDLPEEMKSVKRRRVWTDDGAELDIDRVMTGDPEYWQQTRRDGQARIVNICINYSMSSDNDDTQFPKLLGLAYSVCELAERLGYGTEITAVRSNFNNSPSNNVYYDWERAFTFPLKRSQEPLDVNRIGSISMVGFFRHFSFIIGNGLFTNGVGRAGETSKEMRGFLNADIIIENRWISDGNQKMYVKKAIDKLQKGV